MQNTYILGVNEAEIRVVAHSGREIRRIFMPNRKIRQ